MYPEEITNDEVNVLPLLKFEGYTQIVSKRNGIDSIMDEIMSAPFVGFDTETKPNFVKGKFNDVALVQIALENKVFLLQINKIGMTDKMIRFFRSDVKKIGIALHDDVKALQRLHPFHHEEFINLNSITSGLGIKNQGMRKLAAIILKKRISKSQQLSNWEDKKLTEAQISYAATDAWVCWRMYSELLGKGLI